MIKALPPFMVYICFLFTIYTLPRPPRPSFRLHSIKSQYHDDHHCTCTSKHSSKGEYMQYDINTVALTTTASPLNNGGLIMLFIFVYPFKPSPITCFLLWDLPSLYTRPFCLEPEHKQINMFELFIPSFTISRGHLLYESSWSNSIDTYFRHFDKRRVNPIVMQSRSWSERPRVLSTCLAWLTVRTSAHFAYFFIRGWNTRLHNNESFSKILLNSQPSINTVLPREEIGLTFHARIQTFKFPKFVHDWM